MTTLIYVKKIVCVIDGDPAVWDSLETLMRLNGHDVATYATGRAFLNELDPSKTKCVVCEAELPDTTGITIFEALREQNFEAPFALLVSHDSRGTLDKAQRIGIANVFAKPLVTRQLAAFVSDS